MVTASSDTPLTLERLSRWALLLGSLSLAFVASEATFGVLPATEGSVLNVYNRTNTAGLDCYPTNPRGYFDLDLREPATRARFESLRVRRVEDCAAHAPHAVELRYNSLQFRDREPGTKRPGTRRVAVLGDSFTEGQGVKEEDAYPRGLERAMRAWYAELYGERNREGWARTRGYIERMHRAMRLRGGHFLVATWPVLAHLDGDYPFGQIHDAVGRFCHAAGIAWLDLLPALRGRPAEELWVHALDAHPNEVAHRLAAESLAPAVRRLTD